jgi:hypothetical protein
VGGTFEEAIHEREFEPDELCAIINGQVKEISG